MAQPSSRQELIDYCLRQLGAPVVEINVADEQVQDLLDDAIQMFQQRHFDGVIQTFLKYEITEADKDRAKAVPPGAPSGRGSTGMSSSSATTSIEGTSTTFTYYENSNYLQIPSDVIGINKVYQFDQLMGVKSSNMFSLKYQMFLNDMYYWGTTDILTYAMGQSYLETLNFLLNTHKAIRFNQRQDRMYLDVSYDDLIVGDYLIIDCWKVLNPNDATGVFNDPFLKRYLTALIKRQWGQNLIKFQGVKLPGGIEFNGRQIFDDAQAELDKIEEKMLSTYEIPPLDLIG
tara:strand:+ start:283 stop:1146 length:864 start_codon:yes stop_codon:yes gene_type:complete